MEVFTSYNIVIFATAVVCVLLHLLPESDQ